MLKPPDEKTRLTTDQKIVYMEKAQDTGDSPGSESPLDGSSVSENENIILSGHVRKMEGGEVFDVWSVPGGGGGPCLLCWLLVWPGLLLMSLTIPDCRRSPLRRWFAVTFFAAIVWVGLLSYFSVWMVTVIGGARVIFSYKACACVTAILIKWAQSELNVQQFGDTFQIPETISGITLLAVGTSMPEAITSVIVAKNGLGNMALCNLLGSNVFDILFCLGGPWFVKAAFLSPTHNVVFSSAGVSFSAAVLLTLVLLLYLCLVGFQWKLDLRLGVMCLVLYATYIVIACLYEMNVFGVVNNLTCM